MNAIFKKNVCCMAQAKIEFVNLCGCYHFIPLQVYADSEPELYSERIRWR